MKSIVPPSVEGGWEALQWVQKDMLGLGTEEGGEGFETYIRSAASRPLNRFHVARARMGGWTKYNSEVSGFSKWRWR